MQSLVTLLFGALVLVALAMFGLSLGVLFKKKTPLKGSCRGVSCEQHGVEGEHEGCLCAQKEGLVEESR